MGSRGEACMSVRTFARGGGGEREAGQGSLGDKGVGAADGQCDGQQAGKEEMHA